MALLDIWWIIGSFVFAHCECIAEVTVIGGLLSRLFSHVASASQRVTSKEEGKKIDGCPTCSTLAGCIPLGFVRRGKKVFSIELILTSAC